MDEETQRDLCDAILFQALKILAERAEIDRALILDRVLTYAAAETCNLFGKAAAAIQFRAIADRMEGGVFDHVTGEGGPTH